MKPHKRKEQTQAKELRQASRDKLYQAVREGLNGAGILSSSYKFKVLAIEEDNPTYIILIDMGSTGARQSTKSLQDLEAMIAQGAKRQYGIKVKSVFWRYLDISQIKSQAPARLSAAAPAPKPQRAFARHVAAEVPVEASNITRGLRKSSYYEDFGDTQAVDLRPMPALSPTQYGDL